MSLLCATLICMALFLGALLHWSNFFISKSWIFETAVTGFLLCQFASKRFNSYEMSNQKTNPPSQKEKNENLQATNTDETKPSERRRRLLSAGGKDADVNSKQEVEKRETIQGTT